VDCDGRRQGGLSGGPGRCIVNQLPSMREPLQRGPSHSARCTGPPILVICDLSESIRGVNQHSERGPSPFPVLRNGPSLRSSGTRRCLGGTPKLAFKPAQDFGFEPLSVKAQPVVRHTLGESQKLREVDGRGVEVLIELLGHFELPEVELAEARGAH
jgi:hypothetical protein